jgi:uncharacterized protein (TIGR02421 family)
MQRLEISEIIEMIENQIVFEAIPMDGSFQIKINRYLPYCCTAIHDGGNLTATKKSKIALDNYNRWYEEDPHTGDFISSMPITLIGNDSRYEYDLNRSPENCVYDEAWGNKVWKKKLTPKEKQEALTKHSNYYKVTFALIKQLEKMFGGCVVYDMHSYNHQRWDREVPLFNIGTERLDQKKFGKYIDHWKGELATIKLPNIENVTAINDVFQGKGYNLEFITSHFKNTLVLATEVKKVYCNELTGESFPKIVKELQQKLKKAILNNVNFFSQSMTNWKPTNASKLLDQKIEKSLLSVDKSMTAALKNFELLAFVNPNNTDQEKKKFIKSKFTEVPKFTYSPIKINPYELKQQLGQLRTQDISDISIRHMYESVINSYYDKTDLLGSLGTSKFLYNSLRYFGRPSKKDLQNAQYILHLPYLEGAPKLEPSIDAKTAMTYFKAGLEGYGFKSKMEISHRVLSKVMVLSSRKTILFKPDAKFTMTEINALIEHEIGVHMVTTMNGSDQQLRLFKLGLPLNTMTQEGLALLAEYLSGNLTMGRLKKLAYRVIVVDMMCNGANFKECFNFLMGHIDDVNEAFSITTRIFRGGGFTKDHVYLSGFIKILRFYQKGNSLDPLLIGKTSLGFYNTINEMIDRDMIVKPAFITKSFVDPQPHDNSDIYNYILSGLK